MMRNMRFRNPGQPFVELLLDAWIERAWLECIAIHWCIIKGRVTASRRQKPIKAYFRHDRGLHDYAKILSTLHCLKLQHAIMRCWERSYALPERLPFSVNFNVVYVVEDQQRVPSARRAVLVTLFTPYIAVYIYFQLWYSSLPLLQ
jgi:hypothetical protein